MYDHGGISSNILSSSMRNSSDNIDGDNSPLLTLTPFPFDNDASDSHHSNDTDDCRRDTVLSTTTNSLGLIKRDNDSALSGSTQGSSNIAYDPGSINNSDHCNLTYDPDGDIHNSSSDSYIAYDLGGDTNDKGDDSHLVYDPGSNHFVNNKSSNENIHCYELAQAARLIFNAALLPSASLPPRQAKTPVFFPLTLRRFTFVSRCAFCLHSIIVCVPAVMRSVSFPVPLPLLVLDLE